MDWKSPVSVAAEVTARRSCVCGDTPTKSRPPQGWRVEGDKIWCPKCLNRHFIRRAVTLPIRGPVNMTWKEFDPMLRSAWHQATALANWSVLQLLKSDVIRRPGEEKMPKLDTVDLYKKWNAEPYDQREFWKGGTQAASAIMRAAELRYRKERWHTIWMRQKVPPTYRYPMPFPLHQQAWSIMQDADNLYVLTASLPGGRVQLQLRRGKSFDRQVYAIRQLLDGNAMQGEAALLRRRVGGDNGQVGHDQRVRFRVMVKLVMWLPRTTVPTSKALGDEDTRVVSLKTDTDHFLIAVPPGRGEPWYLNMDQLRGQVIAHERLRHRMSTDLKFEKRWPKHTRDRMTAALALHCDKQHNRLQSVMQQACAQIAGVVRRSKATHVVYDDTVDTYIDPFPWSIFRTMLAAKIDEAGAVLVHQGAKAKRDAKESEETVLVEDDSTES